ncbi:MAG: hypothetical protein JNK01_21180 [Devosia sp.]|nr:hypothetical protein [Devosia sp.]
MSWIADFVFLFLAPERRVWRGEAPLGNVFWGHGVGLSLVIAGLYGLDRRGDLALSGQCRSLLGHACEMADRHLGAQRLLGSDLPSA